jgi:hypothetical protein
MTDLYLRGKVAQQAGESYVPTRVGTDGSLVMAPRYQELASRGQVFNFSRAAVTLPVNAATLVSLFGLYNPPSSGKMLEIIDVEAHAVVATTVVNALGVYFSQGSNASGATFTTRTNTIISARVGEGLQSVCEAYSAVTHVGTPVLAAIVGGWGAVTDGGSTPVRKEFNGSLQFPPGSLIALAMTTAAATGSGITLGLRWAEVPYLGM